MAWDDAPPGQNLTQAAGWDSQPPDSDLQPPKTLEGFLGNVVSNVGRDINPINIAEGLGSTVKQGLYDIPKAAAESSVDLLKGAAKAATGGGLPSEEDVANTPIIQKTREMTEPIAKDPLGYAYKNPVDAASLVAAPFLGLAGGEEAAAAAPEEEAEKAGSIGQRLAARTTAQALDVNPLAMRKLATKAGTSPEEAILTLGDKANELIPNLIEPLDTANTKFMKILDAHDEAGSTIGKIVDDATRGTGTALPEAKEAIGALRNAAENYYQVDGGDLALQKTAERLENLDKAGKLDFDRLSQVKSAIGKGFNKAEAPPGTEEIYGILNDHIDKVLDRLAVDDPTLGPEFAKAKQIYTVTSRLLPAMSRTAAREVSGASIGGGVFSKMIPSAIGGAIGGVPGAALAGGAKYLQEAIAPDLGKNLAYMAMKAHPHVVAAIQKAFPTLTKAEAATMAARIGQKDVGMAKGGIVPGDVREYVNGRC